MTKDNEWIVVEGRGDAFLQKVKVGEHEMLGDQPESAGGKDEGPAPYDFLLVALGCCTSMTLGAYARRKKWPLESVKVRLRHSKIHAEDCNDCETKEGMLDRIELELSGNLDAQQKTQLLAISKKCPVHRTLTSEIKIQTELI